MKFICGKIVKKGVGGVYEENIAKKKFFYGKIIFFLCHIIFVKHHLRYIFHITKDKTTHFHGGKFFK